MESHSSLIILPLSICLIVFLVINVVDVVAKTTSQGRIQDLIQEGMVGTRSLEGLQSRLGALGVLSMLLQTVSVVGVTLSAVGVLISLTSASWLILSVAGMGVAILLILTQALMRIWARHSGEGLVRYFAPLVLLILVKPLDAILRRYPRTWPGGASVQHQSSPSGESEGAIGPLFSEMRQEDSHESRMIRAILRLERTTARDVMVPRLDISAAPVHASLKAVVELMLEGGHSRIPIYEGTVDQVVGVVHARDLVRHLGQSQEIHDVQEIARPPFFIPDSKPLDELLKEFQEKRSHLAIAVDEYGGTAGIVSIEDLLEEIVGDIADEFDVGEPEVEIVGPNEMIMEARVSLDQVNDFLATNLEGEGFDTLGGLVYSQLGKIPNPGDQVESNGLRIQVISTLGRRIKKVRVARINPLEIANSP